MSRFIHFLQRNILNIAKSEIFFFLFCTTTEPHFSISKDTQNIFPAAAIIGAFPQMTIRQNRPHHFFQRFNSSLKIQVRHRCFIESFHDIHIPIINFSCMWMSSGPTTRNNRMNFHMQIMAFDKSIQLIYVNIFFCIQHHECAKMNPCFL